MEKPIFSDLLICKLMTVKIRQNKSKFIIFIFLLSLF